MGVKNVRGVITQDGSPVMREVRVYRADNGGLITTSWSDESGFFEINTLHQGDVFVEAIPSAGYKPMIHGPVSPIDGTWTPSSLFENEEVGGWYDPYDPSTLWKDVGGVVSVEHDGDLVARIDDKSGNENHATQSAESKRPVFRTSGAHKWLEFDGVDDALLLPDGITIGEGSLSIHAALKPYIESIGNLSIFSKGQTDENELLMYFTNGKLRYYADLAAVDALSSIVESSEVGSVFESVINDSSAAIYTNGNIRASVSGSANVSTSKRISLCSSNEGTDRFTRCNFYGLVWRIEDLNYASNEAELLRNYLAITLG